MDGTTLLAILFCIGLLFFWQSYMSKKYPQTEEPQTNSQIEQEAEPRQIVEQAPFASPTELKEEKLILFEGENLEFKISSQGMGLKDVVLKKYKDREGNNISFSQNFPLFSTRLEDRSLDFEIEKTNQNTYVGRHQSQNLTITKTFEIDEKAYLIQSKTTSTKPVEIQVWFNERIDLIKSAVFFLPNYENSSYYVNYLADNQRQILLDDPIKKDFKNLNTLSIENHYFARAIIDDSIVRPELSLEYSPSSSSLDGKISYKTPKTLGEASFEHKIYIGPKEKTTLLNADPRLKNVLDYGFFAWIAHPIMDMIRLFFSWTKNWGVSIILMTIVIRFLLLPFNIMSHNSMKKMQAIQPKLKALQEKYKDDKLELNKATMNLMKESGANPLGGCLPMLLQFPVFIALFKVLGVGIEFYQAPFLGWISDLSKRDPYFVLPVLMAASMILHQKISPSTPDPRAKKIMLVMTVVFSLFMVVYPSGLALYIFIGSLFSILQQLLLTKLEKKSKGGNKN